MTNNTPSGAKKHRESTEPESHQTAKMFFFLLLLLSSSSSDGLVQICVTLSWWFSHKTAAFSTELCTSPSLFSRFGNHTRHFEPPTEELWLPLRRHFSSCVRMHTNHLATKCNYYKRANDCWIRNTVGVRGVFEESLGFFSQYCIGNLWGETCCSVIDGKLQLKHASAAKKMTWTRIKTLKM